MITLAFTNFKTITFRGLLKNSSGGNKKESLYTIATIILTRQHFSRLYLTHEVLLLNN